MSIESDGPALPEGWWVLRSEPDRGAANMAWDASLMAVAAHTGRGIWRSYGWSQPTVSFGRNETVRGRCTPAALEAAGLDAVRRPTGGRALLHATEVTYSVALPIRPGTPWTALYAAINAILVAALRTLGVPAELAPRNHGAALRPVGPVCFDQPAEGEIMVRGAKLVGSAVWRDRGAYLQHGSILLANHQHRLQEILPEDPAGRLTPPPTTLAELLPACPRFDTVADALERALAEAAAPVVTLEPLPAAWPPPEELARHIAHFQDPAWLWRR